jgi:hypothetical protein
VKPIGPGKRCHGAGQECALPPRTLHPLPPPRQVAPQKVTTDMETDNPYALLRALKGAPLAVLIAIRIFPGTATLLQLATATGYDTHTCSKATTGPRGDGLRYARPLSGLAVDHHGPATAPLDALGAGGAGAARKRRTARARGRRATVGRAETQRAARRTVAVSARHPAGCRSFARRAKTRKSPRFSRKRSPPATRNARESRFSWQKSSSPTRNAKISRFSRIERPTSTPLRPSRNARIARFSRSASPPSSRNAKKSRFSPSAPPSPQPRRPSRNAKISRFSPQKPSSASRNAKTSRFSPRARRVVVVV